MSSHRCQHRRGGKTSVAFLLGGELPLLQVVYDPAGDSPGISWFTLVFSDAPPPGAFADVAPVCLGCVVDEYGADVAGALDLAVQHGCSIVRDPVTNELVPDPDYFAEDI